MPGGVAVAQDEQGCCRGRCADLAVGDERRDLMHREPVDALRFEVRDRVAAVDGLPGPVDVVDRVGQTAGGLQEQQRPRL